VAEWLAKVMCKVWSTVPPDLSESRRTAIACEVHRMLQQQEQVLELPMSASDLRLYEIRSEQISELVAELVIVESAASGSRF
jgi:hypothetical protein